MNKFSIIINVKNVYMCRIPLKLQDKKTCFLKQACHVLLITLTGCLSRLTLFICMGWITLFLDNWKTRPGWPTFPNFIQNINSLNI